MNLATLAKSWSALVPWRFQSWPARKSAKGLVHSTTLSRPSKSALDSRSQCAIAGSFKLPTNGTALVESKQSTPATLRKPRAWLARS
jgi:hypothetical protein